jgi:peptidoglycan/LPS O-acetylase OafA/YrhL
LLQEPTLGIVRLAKIDNDVQVLRAIAVLVVVASHPLSRSRLTISLPLFRGTFWKQERYNTKINYQRQP